jgi:ABC-2 type transport system ATP-binding protein
MKSTASICGGDPIKVHQLHKNYGSNAALMGMNLAVKSGELFGLIGPDGAGKTTLLQILAGVLAPSAGEVLVLDQTPQHARSDVGYVTQRFSLYPELSVEENLRYCAGLRMLPGHFFRERSRLYLERMGLADFRGRLASQLSGGMKQKLALCCALIYQPRLLLLDEPTVGIDPASRREYWQLLASAVADGVTAVVATPCWDEAEYCDRVALICEGQVQVVGSPHELRDSLVLERYEVYATNLSQTEEILSQQCLERPEEIRSVTLLGDRVDLLVRAGIDVEKHVTGVLRQFGAAPFSVQQAQLTVENIFLLQISRACRPQLSNDHPFGHWPDRKFAIGTPGIEARQLGKSFGNFQAVREVNFAVPYGEIYGLLGANGAGKTTTIQMLCGLLFPSRGEVFLGGSPAHLRDSSVRRKIGYMSQKHTLYGDLTARENLRLYAAAYGVPMSVRQERIDHVLEMCQLAERANELISRLPGGWKQRVAFGVAVMHQPEILFLDEPTAGMEPLARRDLWRIISSMARAGTAVLVSTHLMDEAEYCTRLGLMVAGEIIVEGSPSQLKAAEDVDSLDEAFVRIVRRFSRGAN